MLSQQSHDITDPMAAPQPDPQILGHLFAHIMSSDYSCLSLFGHSSAEGEKEIRSTIRHGTALPLLLSYALGASTCIGRILSKGKKAEIVEAAKDEERFIMGHFDMADAKQGEMLSKLIESLTQVASASISNLFTIARHLPHLQMWLVTRMYGPAEERQYAVTFPPREGWASKVDDDEAAETQTFTPEPERSPEDMQVVFHVTYSGDVKLNMTAEVFLDYPMPSFVGIPLKLNITGLTFDGVGVLAYIKRRAHLCFLAPEDAEALVATGTDLGSPEEHPSSTKIPDPKGALPANHKVGGLIEDIRIESEMGGTESGRQVLKNVDKIEKFILEQVQRIFEDECVYPSFWTSLV